mmetsp:Transcript_23630/g.41951  ORF Transcript_23630/g.41951 Transcript_23630/m.41951 type:complete len:86 (-) Transcript_23630:37-294(-)
MSNEQDNRLSPTRKPSLLGYSVRPIGDGKRSSWSKIAAAWAHKDGEGFEVRFDALPVDGRMVFRTPKDDDRDTGDVIEREPSGLG